MAEPRTCIDFYLANIISSLIQSRIQEKEIRVASIACGPAVEFLDLINKNIIPPNVCFTCLDGEKLAINQIKKKIEISQARGKLLGMRLNLVHQNILTLLRKGVIPQYLETHDLIYGSGFLDYLSDRTTERLIDYLYGCLKKGGILYLVNVSAADHHSRVCLDMLGEWQLHHRSSKDLLNLACRIKSPCIKEIEFEPETKMNIYLKITKC